jgi:hypothetical protein
MSNLIGKRPVLTLKMCKHQPVNVKECSDGLDKDHVRWIKVFLKIVISIVRFPFFRELAFGIIYYVLSVNIISHSSCEQFVRKGVLKKGTCGDICFGDVNFRIERDHTDNVPWEIRNIAEIIHAEGESRSTIVLII